jgi:hypothetical protein
MNVVKTKVSAAPTNQSIVEVSSQLNCSSPWRTLVRRFPQSRDSQLGVRIRHRIPSRRRSSSNDAARTAAGRRRRSGRWCISPAEPSPSFASPLASSVADGEAPGPAKTGTGGWCEVSRVTPLERLLGHRTVPQIRMFSRDTRRSGAVAIEPRQQIEAFARPLRRAAAGQR